MTTLQQEQLNPTLLTGEEIDNLIRYLCDELSFEYEVIVGRRKMDTIVQQRWVIIMALKTSGDLPFAQIAQAVNRHHTTILHAASQHSRMCKESNWYLSRWSKAHTKVQQWLAGPTPETLNADNGISRWMIDLEAFSKRITKFVYGNETGYRIRAFKRGGSISRSGGEGDMGRLEGCGTSKAVA